MAQVILKMIPNPSLVWLDAKESVYLPKRNTLLLMGSPARLM